MPRLTEASRQERRTRIATAALRCFARDGIANTSMADVIRESGLSAGSIYSHFESKAELLQFTVASALESRFAGIVADAAAEEGGASPSRLLQRMLGATEGETAQARTIVQVWSEVARSAELTAVTGANIATLRERLEDLLRPWAAAHADARPVDAVARAATDAVLTVMFGWAVRITLEPLADPTVLRDNLVAAFELTHADAVG